MENPARLEAPDSTIGILLAGGRAARLGGGDKALKMLGGTSLLARVITIVRPQCAALVISANGEVARFADFRLPVVTDETKNFAGPLAGILAGLDLIAVQYPKATFAMSVATDTPFLPADLVSRLHAARGGAEIACARSGGAIHPVIALWPTGIRGELRQALAGGMRKVDRFMSRYRLAYADWPVAPFDPFLNINEPADLAAAERLLQVRGDPPSSRPDVKDPDAGAF